jgi:nucleoside-diphosphate-sugar epimerase
MNKTAIITGGTGFVGSNLCRKLLSLNWDIHLITRKESKYNNIDDIINKINIFTYDYNIENLISYFKKIKADVIFHLASLYISEHNSEQINLLCDSNIKFGLHILESMKNSNTKLIINTGTSWQHYHTEKYNPVNLYAATKESFEKIIKFYTESENIRNITLKIFDTYGENDKRMKLINLLFKYSESGEKLYMSQGEQMINLVHVDDVTEAYVKAYHFLKDNYDIKNKEFGVASGKGMMLKDIVKLFENITGTNINIIWGGRKYRKREVMELWSNYKTVPNWNQKISLKEGLLRYKR